MKSLALALLPFVISAPAAATVVTDSVGDFIPSFAGPTTGDLDVTLFGVTYDPGTELFQISGSLAAALVPESDYYYVIGVNTGAGAIAPFGSIGQGNVIFDQVVIVGSEGEAFLGTESNPLAFNINGSDFDVTVPLSMLPSTGRDPLEYAFNLWPRTQIDNPARSHGDLGLRSGQFDDPSDRRSGTGDLARNAARLRPGRHRAEVPARLHKLAPKPGLKSTRVLPVQGAFEGAVPLRDGAREHA